MTGILALSSAIRAVGQSPCDKFSCAKREACADGKLACSAFRYYVNTGAAHSPYKEFPDRVTRKNPPVMRQEIVATREIFESLAFEAA